MVITVVSTATEIEELQTLSFDPSLAFTFSENFDLYRLDNQLLSSMRITTLKCSGILGKGCQKHFSDNNLLKLVNPM